MTPCYTFLGIFELVDTKFIDGNIFAVLLSDSNVILITIDKLMFIFQFKILYLYNTVKLYQYTISN